MPTRQISNGNVTVWWVPSIAVPASPTPAEINAGTNLSAAISWNNFELGSSGSADVDDRSIVDAGNSVSRGFPDFGATLDFFRDSNSADSTSIYNTAFTLFKASATAGINGFLVVRYGQALPTAVAAASEYVSVYKVLTDAISDDTEGDDSVKFEVNFLPQGVLFEHVLVKTAVAVVAAPATLTLATNGAVGKVAATISGKDVTTGSTYVSSDTTKATVTGNGVVKRIAAGTGVTITISNPAATTSASVALTMA
jgi:hypothetical protein